MSLKTSRRAVLASALAAALVSRGVRAQTLGKIEDDSILGRMSALAEDQSSWPTSILSWADIAGYCDATGIEKPDSFGDDTIKTWSEISFRIPINDDTLFLFMNAPWGEIVGFNPWDIDQVALAGDPPEQLRLYSGLFNPERIERAFSQWGYSSSVDGDFRILANPDDGLDPSRDLDRYALGRFNHVGASESLVIASRSVDLLAEAIDVAAGNGESLADSQPFADLAAAVDGMHGFMILNGDFLSSGIQVPDSDGPETYLPPARTFLAGLRARHDNQLVSFIVDYGDVDAAESAGPRIAFRIHTLASPITGKRYSDDLLGFQVEQISGTRFIRLNVPNSLFASRWQRYIAAGDLLFIASGGVGMPAH